MSAFKKYGKIFSIGMADMFAWRFGFFMMTFGTLISWAALFVLWQAVYADGNQIGTFTLEQLLMYYTFSMAFQVIFDYSFVWDIAEALHVGKLSEFLVKPISYLSFKFTQELGARTASLIAFSIPLIGIIFFFRHDLPQSLIIWLWTIGTLLFGFVLISLAGVIAAMMSVYFQNPHITSSAFMSASLLLSGRMIPIDVMPNWLALISRWSPFPFVSGIPIEFIIGTRTTLSAQELLLACGWFVILLFSSRAIWKWAAIKYEAGGS